MVHPLFSDSRLKLGTFASNVAGGCVKSTLPGRADASWNNALAISKVADQMNFEALVPLSRWRGHGGKTDHGSTSLESYTWAAATGACTSHAAVFSTSHISTMHPLMAAKQGATIDQISGGRFALNVVCGWDAPEMEMFGVPMLEHERRYEAAGEWLHIVRNLWRSPDPVTFEGNYFTVRNARIGPRPPVGRLPPVMNAGTSELGRRFAAMHCDIVFITAQNVTDLSAQVLAYKHAATGYNRSIQVWAYATVVDGDSEEEARRFYHEYVVERGDWEAANGQMAALGIMPDSLPPEVFKRFQEKLVSGGGHLVLGRPVQIVDQLKAMSDAGLDGVLLSWPQYLAGIQRFQERVLPLMREAGLR